MRAHLAVIMLSGFLVSCLGKHPDTDPQPAGEAAIAIDTEGFPLSEELERRPEGEMELIRKLVAALMEKMKRDLDESDLQQQREDTGHDNAMLRAAYPKSPSCVRAEFKVSSPEKMERLAARVPGSVWAEGLIRRSHWGKSFPAVVRLSGATGVQPDYKPDARGMAIKVFGVRGDHWSIESPLQSRNRYLAGQSAAVQRSPDPWQDDRGDAAGSRCRLPFHDPAASGGGQHSGHRRGCE